MPIGLNSIKVFTPYPIQRSVGRNQRADGLGSS
jgi:hypothetical protein